jgi:hypothetical protein
MEADLQGSEGLLLELVGDWWFGLNSPEVNLIFVPEKDPKNAASANLMRN